MRTSVSRGRQICPARSTGTGEELFRTAERDALLGTLDYGLQPGWAPQKPVLHTGLDLVRYNKVEALSLGASATSELGKGFTARLVGRIGTGDWMPNGDLSTARSNGRAELRLAAYHRLAVANDDWGAPLSFGASLANLLYARDEGFYYRSWGAELTGTREGVGSFLGPDAVALLRRAPGQRRRRAEHAGVARQPDRQRPLPAEHRRRAAHRHRRGREHHAHFRRRRPVRRAARHAGARRGGVHRSELYALALTGYGRGLVEATLARGIGRFSAALTGAAGTAIGDLPPQRAFYLGGLQTVRGQFARPDGAGRVGDTFWLGRAELGLGRMIAVRPSLFYDIGWAGTRSDFTKPGRPLSGAGVGLSLLDGIARIDVARGIWPEQRCGLDFSLDARF